MRRGLAMLCVLAALFAACKEQPDRPPPPPRDGPLRAQRCTGLPSRKNIRLPLFSRPFEGRYPVYNVFDHQTPGQTRPLSAHNSELAYCGVELLGLSEGYEGYGWGLPTGTPVLAVAGGEVIRAGRDESAYCPLLNRVVSSQLSVSVRHEGLGGVGYVTIYRHLSEVQVRDRDRVEAGAQVGRSGATGCATEPVFYLGVLQLSGTKSGSPTSVDPYGWDGPKSDPWAQDELGAVSKYLWQGGEAPSLEGRVRATPAP